MLTSRTIVLQDASTAPAGPVYNAIFKTVDRIVEDRIHGQFIPTRHRVNLRDPMRGIGPAIREGYGDA